MLQREINNAQATDGVTVIESATVITDAHGLSSRHLWRPGLKLFVDMMAIQQDNYPETLERVIIIRAPSIFPFLFNMVKGVFDARTRAKFDVVSGDWQKRLKEFIPEVRLSCFLVFLWDALLMPAAVVAPARVRRHRARLGQRHTGRPGPQEPLQKVGRVVPEAQHRRRQGAPGRVCRRAAQLDDRVGLFHRRV